MRMKTLLISVIGMLLFSCSASKNDSSEAKIVGGRTVGEGEVGPQAVSTAGLDNCTATIISENLILTAAHCHEGSLAAVSYTHLTLPTTPYV